MKKPLQTYLQRLFYFYEAALLLGPFKVSSDKIFDTFDQGPGGIGEVFISPPSQANMNDKLLSHGAGDNIGSMKNGRIQ